MSDKQFSICLITHDFPYPERCGGHTYTRNIATSLAASGAHVVVFCFRSDITQKTEARMEGVVWICFPRPKRSLMTQLISKYPILTQKNRSNEFESALLDYLTREKADALIFDSFAMGWVFESLDKLPISQKPMTVYQSHNVESDLRLRLGEEFTGGPLHRLVAKHDAKKVSSIEKFLYQNAAHVSVITQEDKERYKSVFGEASIFHFPPGFEGPRASADTHVKDRGEGLLVLGGRLSKMKQVVLDELLEVTYDDLCDRSVSLLVAGAMSKEYEKKTKSRYPKVEFAGFVEDLQPIIQRCRLGVIADHVGGGFKIRILTYVFNRIPIIATNSAMSGTGLTPGEDYIPVNGYDEVIDAYMNYVHDVDFLQSLQQSAFSKCDGNYSWSVNGSRYFNFLLDAQRRNFSSCSQSGAS